MTDSYSEAAPRIGYWIFNYMPKWEAASKELSVLATSFHEQFGTRTISLDVRGDKVQFFGRDKHLPLPYSLIGLAWLKRAARALEINHVFGSPAERYLTPRLARLGKTILTISKDNPDLGQLERSIETLKSLRYIVVESERHRDLLMQVGIPSQRVKLIYPGVLRQPYRPLPPEPFTILFASSPFGNKYDLLSRGIYLMVRAAALLPEVRFRLVWRGDAPARLERLIREAGVCNVEILTGYIEDMDRMYDTSHSVILPALTDASLKPCPHSALEALAHGKPILVSRPTSLADVVSNDNCGVVFEPNIGALCAGVKELIRNYQTYQAHAQATAESTFSMDVFVERYRRLYLSLLDGH